MKAMGKGGLIGRYGKIAGELKIKQNFKWLESRLCSTGGKMLNYDDRIKSIKMVMEHNMS